MFDKRASHLRVYTADTLMQVALVRNMLEAEGIATHLTNEHLASVAGELPPIVAWPELWVLYDADLDRAKALIAAFLKPTASPGRAWRCADCAAENEAQFGLCWQCGASAGDP